MQYGNDNNNNKIRDFVQRRNVIRTCVIHFASYKDISFELRQPDHSDCGTNKK